MAWASLLFSQVMLASFVMRAVREEMGVSGGVEGLPWLFTGTFLVTLALVPLFGIAAAKLGRRALASAVYGGFAASLVALWLAFAALGDDETVLVVLSRIAFIWLSVINMIAVSTFWGVAVDVFGGERGKQSFGTLAAGGTAGALVGPLLALVLAGRIGTHQLLLVSAAAWLFAMVCAGRLERAVAHIPAAPRGEALGGSALAGLRDVVRNPTLREIGIYVLLYTATSTVIYIVQAGIAKAAYPDRDERTAFFAGVDLVVNVLAITVQLGLTRRLLQRLSMSTVLAILPVATIAILVLLGAWPTLAMLVVVQTLRRALEHAVAKPGRELLYDRVDREAKLKGQNAVDTVVYRAGDAASAWVVGGLQAIGMGNAALALTFAPIALVWAWYARRIAAPERPSG